MTEGDPSSDPTWSSKPEDSLKALWDQPLDWINKDAMMLPLDLAKYVVHSRKEILVGVDDRTAEGKLDDRQGPPKGFELGGRAEAVG